MSDDKEILQRIERLEKAVFGKQADQRASKAQNRPAKGGPKGGILTLISEGFFAKPEKTAEVCGELESRGIYYEISVVQTALNRLSKVKGPLNTFKKGGKKVYVERR